MLFAECTGAIRYRLEWNHRHGNEGEEEQEKEEEEEVEARGGYSLFRQSPRFASHGGSSDKASNANIARLISGRQLKNRGIRNV